MAVEDAEGHTKLAGFTIESAFCFAAPVKFKVSPHIRSFRWIDRRLKSPALRAHMFHDEHTRNIRWLGTLARIAPAS
jgi:hypothetical protein